MNMYDKEERLANLCIIVNYLQTQVDMRVNIKHVLDLYTKQRDDLSIELERDYCSTDEIVGRTKFETLLKKLKS